MSDSPTEFGNLGIDWFIGALSLIGNIAAVSFGVPAQISVANQCIGGRAISKYLVFNGPLQLKDRYAGMKEAFGSDHELFIPERRGGLIVPNLTSENYTGLVEGADKKFQESEKSQPSARQNIWLRDISRFPELEMGFGYFGVFLTVLLTGLALLPLPLIAFVWWWVDDCWIPQIVYILLFILVSAYDRAVLDIRRSVCYIKVPKFGGGSNNLVFDTVWARLHDRAVKGAPDSGSIAIEDLKTGRVRQSGDSNEILIPVMALKPHVGFNAAMALLVVTNLRGPALALSCLFVTQQTTYIMIALCIAAFVQALLQNMSATYFQAEAKPCDIFWFRRLPGATDKRLYPEYAEYRTALS